jgi:hypothetical protein
VGFTPVKIETLAAYLNRLKDIAGGEYFEQQTTSVIPQPYA